jgi:hypothetical protein
MLYFGEACLEANVSAGKTINLMKRLVLLTMTLWLHALHAQSVHHVNVDADFISIDTSLLSIQVSCRYYFDAPLGSKYKVETLGIICDIEGIIQENKIAQVYPCATKKGKQAITLKGLDEAFPIQGVTVFDLYKIYHHVLGFGALWKEELDPNNIPYLMISADVNWDNMITMKDVVGLKKLLLGIFQDFSQLHSGLNYPVPHSYRFVDKSFVFPNPSDPWQTSFPEAINFSFPPNEVVAEFLGMKIGDVNRSVVLKPGEELAHKSFQYGEMSVAKGNAIDLPVFVKSDLSTVSWQTSFRYDVRRVKLTGLRWANQTGEFEVQDWFEPEPGLVNILWYDGEGKSHNLPSGAPLFYMQFEALADQQNVALWLEEGEERNLSYSPDGRPTLLELEPAPLSALRHDAGQGVKSPKPNFEFAIYPNPSHSNFKLELSLSEDCTGQVSVFDVMGKELWAKEWPLTAGHNSLSSGALPQLLTGQYLIRVDTPLGSKTLRFVKL